MNECEICGTVTDEIVGCSECGRMICTGCEAAVDIDPDSDDCGDEPVCEECF